MPGGPLSAIAKQLPAFSFRLPPGLPPSAFAAATAAIPAATTVTAAAPAAPATEAAAARSLGARARFVHREVPAAELMVVELVDRRLGLLVRRHLDEREPTRAAGRHVAHHLHRV